MNCFVPIIMPKRQQKKDAKSMERVENMQNRKYCFRGHKFRLSAYAIEGQLLVGEGGFVSGIEPLPWLRFRKRVVSIAEGGETICPHCGCRV